MARLASSFDSLKDHYEIVVVGSGYGGAIAASRLARAGRQVCLLEQGKEFQPGEYPNTLLEATGEFQVTVPGADLHLGSRTGLYDLHVGPDINVFKGCGLGGTSLVNANVSIRPDRRVFDEYRWPAALKAEAAQADSPLWESYQRAFDMLGANPYPADPSDLDKLNVLQQSAAGMGAGASFRRTDINVTFEAKVSSGGVQQLPCNKCGDCVSGCNYSAKNTTLMNYLPDAVRHGAVIFTKCSVRHLEREDGHWAVCFQRLDSGLEPLDAEPRKLTAEVVVLAGGALGSTEILLRSKQHGLPLSDQVGRGFSGNGDVLGFGYDLTPEVDGMGWGQSPPGRLPVVGPCITGVIDLRDPARPLAEGMIIEEGSIPGAIATFMPEVMAALARVSGQPLPGQGPAPIDELESLVLGPHHGALAHTQTYLVMAHDGGDGVMSLDAGDRLAISWPGVGQRPIFATINQRLKATTAPVGGEFVENPLWAVDPRLKNLTTVHPLGGCRMADSAAEGVVNADCQVFSGAAGDATHPDLYVMDGAVLPCPVGVNPLLTISAVAERSVANLARAKGWTIDYQSAPAPPGGAPPPGVDFTERWTGTLAGGGELVLALTVTGRDLDALLNDAGYGADVHGAATMTQAGKARELAVTGKLSTAPGQVVYELQLSNGTESHTLSARRAVPAQAQPDLFAASTALVAGGDAALAGTLGCAPEDLLNELGRVRVYNSSESERLALAYAVSTRLAGPLADVYGNVTARPSPLAPEAPPRKRRTLLAPAPAADYFESSDGRLLRLLRYQGKGRPVLLVHGLGQSSRLFSVGALQPNLVELLYRYGLDVWLLDDRGSIALPGAQEPFDLDQVAAIDLPESIARIRRATGEGDLALVAHGWGAAAAWMSLLSGSAAGVTSFVSSQCGPVVEAGGSLAGAARLRTDSFWQALGAQALGGYAAQPAPADRVWRLFSSGGGSVDGRVRALYGPVLNDTNLTERTRAALPDLYGPVAVAAGRHVQAIVRAGRLVDATGGDRYLAGTVPDIPVLLLHGSANEALLASGMARSAEWLRTKLPAGRFTATAIPGYGQDDSVLGHHAPLDVFPAIARHLEALRT